MSLSRSLLLALALSSTMACLSPKPNDGDDGTTGDGGGAASSCADLQQGNVAAETLVTLTEVVVTSPLTQEGDGFFVQDKGGGAWSGMYVFLQGSFEGLYLNVGDVLTVTGTYTEYYDFSELTVTGLDDITVTGESDVTVTPYVDGGDMEQWESVLVSVADQTFTACPNSYGETALSGGLVVNDLLYPYEADRNATVDELVGLVEYSFEEWKLNPRSQDDLVGFTAGDGCTYTPAEIHDQAATDPDGLGSVELQGLVVTSGLTESGTPGFFVQAPGGGEKSGLFIFLHEKVDQGALDLQPGDVVDITGSATVYYDMTEVAVYDAGDIVETGAGAEVVATELTDAPSDWNFWEGALVTLEEVAATTGVDSYGVCETDWGVNLDDWLSTYTASAGTTWDSVTGQIAYSYGATVLLPRDATDLSGGEVITTTATVQQVQDGTVAEGSLVTLEGVIATSPATGGGSGFFVQDAGGGEWSGVYVYMGGADWDVQPGDELTVVGTVTEYFDLTEIVVASDADVVKTGTGTPVASMLGTAPADWEPYEGVLVTLEGGVEATSDLDENGQVSTDWGLFLDDLFFEYTAAEGDTWATVTGPLYYSYSEWKVCPRTAADLAE